MHNFHFRQLFIAMVALLCSVAASAHDFEVGGVFYKVTSETNLEVEVTYKGSSLIEYDYEYSGDVVIPSSVSYNGKTYSVTSIGNSAFYYCSGLTSITIPNSVTSIGSSAFYNCRGLTSVIIPNSVTSIGECAFLGCSRLTSIIVESDNAVYDSRDNCNAIIKTVTNTLVVGCKNTIIPNSVTSIGDYAFYECSSLTSVTIPNSVTSIGNYAFDGCSGLTSVTIPNSVTSIGDYAFFGCSGLTSITIPNSVTSIGDNAFYGCRSLTSVTIPNSVTSIGDRAFLGCSGLTSITIPNSVTSIGKEAFYGTAWYNSQPDGVVYAGKVLYEYKGEIPSGTSINIKEGTLCIARSAFNGCRSLTSVTIPNSVTSIGNSAFYECSGLKDVYISDLAAWCNIDFEDNTSNPLYYSSNLYLNGELVKDLTIPNSVTSIGDYAFRGCSSLTSVIIPNSVTSIGYSAFNGCSNLTSVIIPNSVTSIGDYAFLGCSGLTSVTIPNSVTSIGDNAFYNCSGLTSITIPNSVTSIGDWAFEGCSGLTSIVVENRNIVYDSRNNCNAIIETKSNTLVQGCKNTFIPNSVTSIGNGAFCWCISLTSVTIPNSVTSIGYSAFYECTGLTSVTIGNSVTSIGNQAFYGCSSLTSITIPNSVTSIGYSAFYECTGLKTVINLSSLTISKGSYDNGHVGYYADKVITVPNGSIEGDFVWAKIDGDNTLCGYIGNATELSLPENYKGENYVIGDYAFYYCSSLTSVTIPNSVTSIGAYAFCNCKNLKSVHIPDITDIGTRVFDNCDNLTNVSLNCKRVGDIISGNSRIKELVLGNNVIGILDNALNGCSGIRTIKITKSTPPKVGTGNFTSSHYQRSVLYIPKGSLAAYQAADVWKDFWEIIEFDATGIDDVHADVPTFEITAGGIQLTGAEGKAVAVYTTSGALVEKVDCYDNEEIILEKGVYILRVGGKSVKVKL